MQEKDAAAAENSQLQAELARLQQEREAERPQVRTAGHHAPRSVHEARLCCCCSRPAALRRHLPPGFLLRTRHSVPAPNQALSQTLLR